jgi:drug/metabolite transporter (DMT)-like permease
MFTYMIIDWYYDIQDASLISALLSQPVLIALAMVLCAAAGCVAGYGLDPSGTGATWQSDPDFYNLLWQALLQIMATYCSFVTVLRDRRSIRNNHEPESAKREIAFYTFAVLSIACAIVAPIAFVHFPGQGVTSASATILNFAATVFALIPAVEVAARFNQGHH